MVIKIILAVLVLNCNWPPDCIAQSEIPTSSVSCEVVSRVSQTLAPELVRRGLELGSPIFIRIFKQSRELEVWVQADSCFAHFRTYPVCSMSGDLGPKLRIGDHQAPEGFYFITPRQLNPYSQFHLSFNLGYPNTYDRQHGRTGSALMVHGNCVSIGCFAMTDPGIEEIYTLAETALRNGQAFFRVHIFPFRMTGAQLQQHANTSCQSFWENLQSGFEFFEQHRRPPDVQVEQGEYRFGASW